MSIKGRAFSVKTKLLLGLAVIIVLASSGCRPANPKYETVVPAPQPVEVGAKLLKLDVTPKVDILVIIDNSKSMKKHQDNLAANIQGFVDAFAKNKLLDFHF